LNVLLTGAAGFIGKNLLAYLKTKGIKVTCVVRDKQTLLDADQNVDFSTVVEGDLTEPCTLAKLPQEADVLIHSAARLGEWGGEKRLIMQANVEVTDNLLKWFSRTRCKQFLFISTPGVQGFGHKLAKETDPYHPRGVYEESKVLAEERVRSHSFASGQYWTIIRPDFVYGPGDLRRIRLYKRIMTRKWVKIGKGTSVVRPTHVGDVCRAVYMCLEAPRAYSQVFNIGGAELMSSQEYINKIALILGVKLPPFRIPTAVARMGAAASEWLAKITDTKPMVTRGQIEFLTEDHGTEISKIRDVLGFEPTTGFDAGMRSTLSWARGKNLL
jgi:nucleoside-diphosphate-sugar epimerase